MYGIVFTIFNFANVGLPNHLTHCLHVITSFVCVVNGMTCQCHNKCSMN